MYLRYSNNLNNVTTLSIFVYPNNEDNVYKSSDEDIKYIFNV